MAWFWKKGNKLVQADESGTIELEYQAELKGQRCGQIVYHCFGDKGSACVNFNTMRTYCGSGRCMLNHQRNNLEDEHMSFELVRK
jgi:hypothetical protein